MTPPAAKMAAAYDSAAAILITGNASALRGGEVQNQNETAQQLDEASRISGRAFFDRASISLVCFGFPGGHHDKAPDGLRKVRGV